MRGSNVYFFTLEEERSTQDRSSADQQWMHREGTNPTYRSSKMYSYGSCFLWSCFYSQNYHWSSCKMEVRLGSCVGVGLTSGTAVKETDYRQTPTSPAAQWLKLEKRRGWRDCFSTDSKKYGFRWMSWWWHVSYSWTWMLVLAHATLLLLLLI